MTYKLPPLPEPSWPFGSKYNGKDMQAYAIAAIEAQGVPDDADVWCEYVAEMVGAYISEPVGSENVKAIAGIIRRRMPQRFFASAPPAPQAKPQPLTSDQKWDMWTAATIEQPSARGCYFRGVEDAEHAHRITKEWTC